jgi:GNAT superfamily N-acetyltransferase
VSDQVGTLAFTVEPIDAPESLALIHALHADLDERYKDDGNDVYDCYTLDSFLTSLPPQLVAPPAGAFVVARLDGAPVACAAVRGTEEPGLGELKRMYVVPEARGRGISRLVLARIEGEARTLGFDRIRLETGIRQPEAIALYETSGYEPIALFGQYVDDPLSRCFAKSLT